MEEDESRLLAEQLSGQGSQPSAAMGGGQPAMNDPMMGGGGFGGGFGDVNDIGDARPQVVE